MTALLLSDATATAALTRLLHDWTGCDIPQTDTTPQSEVEELVPLCLSILRRHWQTPLTALGDGTTPMSLADLLRRLIGDRVQGNEALCIPPVHDNIPAAVAALARRKLTGPPELPDGLSFARIFCDSTIPPITELIDDNIGWVWDAVMPTTIPSITKMVIGCKEAKYNPSTYAPLMLKRESLEELEFPNMERCDCGNLGYLFDLPNLQRVSFPSMKSISACNESCFKSASVKEIYMPSLQTVIRYNWGTFLSAVPSVEKIVFGNTQINGRTGQGADFVGCTKLIHLEFADGMDYTTNLSSWNPTDKGSLFLSNFRLYIADRLSDNGSGLTLTLSQAVRDAIHSAGIDTIITNKGWTISPVPTQQ